MGWALGLDKSARDLLTRIELANKRATQAIKRKHAGQDDDDPVKTVNAAVAVALSRDVKLQAMVQDVTAESSKAVTIMKSVFIPVMIRRTARSTDYKGHRIGDLPECERVTLFGNLNEKEAEVFRSIEKSVIEKSCVFIYVCLCCRSFGFSARFAPGFLPTAVSVFCLYGYACVF